MRTSVYSKLSSLFILLVVSSSILFSYTPDPVRGKIGMVVSASSLASKAGLEILKKGGNAIDAAVATGFALAVTYPSAGNIGGGGFMVIHLNDGTNTTIDFREIAPQLAHRDMYLDEKGNFNPALSMEGGTSAGVPGSVAGLLYVLEKYGTMELRDVLQPAIDLAEKGFVLDYRTAETFKYAFGDARDSTALSIFKKKDDFYSEGELFRQPELAEALRKILNEGLNGFYQGKIAEAIVSKIKKSGGIISLEDLINYKPVERQPVYGNYRGYDIVSMPPPSSGGIALIQSLNILEYFKFNKDEWGSSRYYHHLIEAWKYVYADRSRHLGDPDFYNVPVNKLISKKYSGIIAGRISDTAVLSSYIVPGDSNGYYESEETTHYSIIDKDGNAVSTTTTLNSAYGSRIVVDGWGFLLNNEMDDFSSKPGEANQYGLIGSEANSIQPGKRMLSSMTPTIILKDNKPYMVIGSPGGSTIITVVIQVVLNCIDFNMNISGAIGQPRIHHQWLPDQIDYEEFALPYDVKDNLIKMNHKPGLMRSLGRAEGILIDIENGIYYGSTDPRGYGSAEGY